MNKLRNGGPAFPGHTVNDTDGNLDDPFGTLLPPNAQATYSGMSLRDYFAAHAPTEIPAWFVYGDDRPPIPHILDIGSALALQPGLADLFDFEQENLRQWLYDGSWDLEPKLEAIGHAASKAIAESREARRAAEEQREADRYFAWRWHYADNMIRSA
jgi:hypothetical protein